MQRTDTVIIGGGQAGLAMSGLLSEDGRDHVVLERGHVAERWRSARWDSLRLLTPNWMTRLPRWQYQGAEPEGFMSAPEVADFLVAYAGSFSPPVHAGTAVTELRPTTGGFVVRTNHGDWTADRVVIATGHSDTARRPPAASNLSAKVAQFDTTTYRHPGQLPHGGVLVVGAAASGVQLADELARAGRPVTLAVGRHRRMPRQYRGMEIMWWLERIGSLDRSIDEMDQPDAARREPSLQLVGRAKSDRSGPDLDLGVLSARGVRLAGRLLDVDGTRVHFSDDLTESTSTADAALVRLLDRIDGHIEVSGLTSEVLDADRPRPLAPRPGPESVDLASDGITSVVWATGYRRDYRWLRVPVLDARGEIVHCHGVTPQPGLYVLGLQFQRRRRSSFIDGVGDDAQFLADHIAGRLARPRPQLA